MTLQQKLQAPQVKDIIAINAVVKRLKAPSSPTCIFFWKLKAPIHISVVSDASGANKQSNHAMKGISLLVSEDRLGTVHANKDVFLDEETSQRLGGKCHAMLASSTKPKRISHSTSHAETLSAARGLPMGQLLAIRYSEADIARK